MPLHLSSQYLYNILCVCLLHFLQSDLSKKFKVSGIPTLVFVSGEDGALITADGRNVVMEDPTGGGFPWKPKPFTELIKGEFVNKDGEKTNWDDLNGKVIGLYFSAHWVSPGLGRDRWVWKYVGQYLSSHGIVEYHPFRGDTMNLHTTCCGKFSLTTGNIQLLLICLNYTNRTMLSVICTGTHAPQHDCCLVCNHLLHHTLECLLQPDIPSWYGTVSSTSGVSIHSYM